MRLINLQLTGVGPFRGSYQIDFASLGINGLFLLEGNTGSGKSTILDAIVFALYGQTSGGKGPSLERIRSRYCEPKEPSQVKLIFENNSGIYRITRTPAYLRKKSRGEGTTEQKATAILERITDPDGIEACVTGAETSAIIAPVSSNIAEVGREITQIVGLNREQFQQTMMLPQGEFARFLKAGSDERQKVLEKVFGIGTYLELEKYFEERRRQARTITEQADEKVRRAVTALTTAAEAEKNWVENLDDALAGGEEEKVLATAAELRAEITAAADEAAEKKNACQAQLDEAVATEKRIGENSKNIKERLEIAEIETWLENQAEANAEIATQLARHSQAASVKNAIAATKTVAEKLDQYQNTLHEYLQNPGSEWSEDYAARAEAATLNELTKTYLARPDQVATLEELGAAYAEAQTQLDNEVYDLKRLLELEKDLVRLDSQIAETEKGIKKTSAKIEKLDEKQSTLAKEILSLEETAAQLEAKLEAYPDTSAEVAVAEQTLSEAKKAARLKKKVAEKDTAVQGAKTQMEEKIAAETEVRRNWINGMAEDLAGSLEAGKPCPVCGGIEHPAPATGDGNRPSKAAVEAAETERRQAENAFAAACASLEAARAEYREQEEILAGVDEKTARVALTTAKKQLQAQQQDAAAFSETGKALSKAQKQHTQSLTQLENLKTEVAVQTSSLKNLEEQRTRNQTEIKAACGKDESIQAKTLKLENQIAYVQVMRGKIVTVTSGKQQLEDTEERAAAALAETNFSDPEQALAALLPADDLAQKTEFAQTYRDRSGEVKRRLENEAVKNLDAQELIQTNALEIVAKELLAATQAKADAQTAYEAQLASYSRASAKAEATRKAEQALARAVSARGKDIVAATRIIKLANLVTGTLPGAERVRLSTYVLMQRFDEVLASANTRLKEISEDRYELRRAKGGSGNKKTGLDLILMDYETGQERPVETLSGGETFYASLCLALGLADVVTAEAGGVELNSLFIDEGFGSLDPEKLEAVINTLQNLSSGGRSVGIVSHVSELKQRIAERIRVTKTETGPSELQVIA